jgi:hypothetical protein
MDMTHMDSSTLWWSVLWGGIAGGYIIYGMRQKSGIPFAGGVAMSLACFLPALWMSLASVAIMFAVWWLLKQGY